MEGCVFPLCKLAILGFKWILALILIFKNYDQLFLNSSESFPKSSVHRNACEISVFWDLYIGSLKFQFYLKYPY